MPLDAPPTELPRKATDSAHPFSKNRIDNKKSAFFIIYWYALILLLFLILFLWAIRKLRNDLVSVFHDEEGGVQITTQALQELVKKSCLDIEGIDAPTTKIKSNRGTIRLHVRLSLNPEGDIKQIRTMLRNKIEKIMVENLNFSNFGGVDIVIKGFQDK